MRPHEIFNKFEEERKRRARKPFRTFDVSVVCWHDDEIKYEGHFVNYDGRGLHIRAILKEAMARIKEELLPYYDKVEGTLYEGDTPIKRFTLQRPDPFHRSRP